MDFTFSSSNAHLSHHGQVLVVALLQVFFTSALQLPPVPVVEAIGLVLPQPSPSPCGAWIVAGGAVANAPSGGTAKSWPSIKAVHAV